MTSNIFVKSIPISQTNSILNSPVEYLTGVSVARGDLLRKELRIFTFRDLLEHYPLRHVDKTRVDVIGSLNQTMDYAQVAGQLIGKEIIGQKKARRLVAHVKDGTGVIELVWFQGITWIDKMLHIGQSYLIFGKLGFFMNKPQLAHPEIEIYSKENAFGKSHLEPLYPTTEKLKAKGLTAKAFHKLIEEIFRKVNKTDLAENIPEYLLERFKLPGRYDAIRQIHFPINPTTYQQALRRLKFEEFFFAQFALQKVRIGRSRNSKGILFEKVGTLFNAFYQHHLPFELTSAQKRVLKEIRKDTASGAQMNRLLQGDVGSGKTMVALLSMLMAADNGYQSVLMAPTEILAQQHFNTINEQLQDLPVKVGLLTGSTSTRNRKPLLESCADGSLQILIGTHAIIEDQVAFQNLGLGVVDEQHKFGVAQRAKLWKKNTVPPHILVMTATPIPRTLALTTYGDLDYSVIDELPPGRQPIHTTHRFENARPQIMDFIKEQLQKGRQAYVIYPLIEESSAMDYENLMKGYEEVKSFFPEPKYWISMVHGKQDADSKEVNMKRFASGDTHILVGTTVIEVGVNVPNASVMVIESAEKFGLSQLHQLRGRVGRGAEKSYCVLLTGSKLSHDARERLKIMTATNDGFKIAEKDLEIRGPGEIEGTRQSGALMFKVADIVNDRNVLEAAREAVTALLEEDFDLQQPAHQSMKHYIQHRGKTAWSKIA